MRKLLTLLLLLLMMLTSSAMAAEKSAYRLADEQGTLLALSLIHISEPTRRS